jgi:hypothetical protein
MTKTKKERLIDEITVKNPQLEISELFKLKIATLEQILQILNLKNFSKNEFF